MIGGEYVIHVLGGGGSRGQHWQTTSTSIPSSSQRFSKKKEKNPVKSFKSQVPQQFYVQTAAWNTTFYPVWSQPDEL